MSLRNELKLARRQRTIAERELKLAMRRISALKNLNARLRDHVEHFCNECNDLTQTVTRLHAGWLEFGRVNGMLRLAEEHRVPDQILVTWIKNKALTYGEAVEQVRSCSWLTAA